MDSTGIPAIDQQGNDWSTAEVNPVLGIETPQVSIGSLVEGILMQADGAQEVYVDLVERKISARAIAPAPCIKPIIDALDTGYQKTFTPDAGQEGRSLTWGRTVGEDFDGATDTATNEVVDTAKPRRTLGSLINALLAAVDDNTHMKGIYINQEDAEVRVIDGTAPSPNAIETALSDHVDPDDPANADYLALALSEPSEASVTPLIFEGGPTS